MPSADLPAFPRAQSVVFHFKENPHFVILDSGEHLCDQLKASGKPVIRVDLDLFGNFIEGYRGFRTDAYDGRPLVGEGWSSSGAKSQGADDPIGPDPLAQCIKLFPMRRRSRTC